MNDRFRIFNRLVLVGAMIGQAGIASAGGMDSGGGEIINFQYNPWFIGEEPGSYCIEKSAEYSQGEAEAIAETTEAVDDWASTLNALDTYESRNPMPDGKRKTLTKSFVYHSQCQEQTDLKIYLGVMTEDVRNSLKSNPYGAVSYAKMTNFDKQSGRAKGYIWVNPDLGPDSYQQANKAFWNKGRYTYHVMLHELGHVMGVHHDAPLIFMDHRWPHDLVKDGIGSNELLKLEANYTTRTLLKLGVLVKGYKVCSSNGSGLGYSNSRAALETIFGTDFDWNKMNTYEFCFEKNTSSPALSRAALELRLKTGELLKVVPIEISSGDGLSLFVIRGRYPKHQVPNELDDEMLASFNSAHYGAKILLPGLTLPVMLNNNDKFLNISFFHQDRWSSLELYFSPYK